MSQNTTDLIAKLAWKTTRERWREFMVLPAVVTIIVFGAVGALFYYIPLQGIPAVSISLIVLYLAYIAFCIVFYNALTRYKKEGAGKPLMPPGALKPILWVLIPSAAMVVITELVGLHIAAALFLAFYMRVVGKIGWATTLLVGIISPLLLYVTFDKLFLIPLPQGLWGGYLLRF